MDPDPPPARRARQSRASQDFSLQKDLHLDPITRNLRRAFDDVAAEPLSDEIIDLLRQIDEAAGGERAS